MGLFFQWDRVERTFADQFEPDGANFRYRRWQKGAPIEVTAAERQQFIDQFGRQIRRGGWGIGVGVILLIGAVALLLPGESGLSDIMLYAALGAVLAAFLGYWFWAYTAPSRALASRIPVGRARSRAEVSRHMLKNATYGQLGAAVGGAVLLVWSQSRRHDLFAGWNRLWLLFLVVIIVGCGIQAFRKWLFEREDSGRRL